MGSRFGGLKQIEPMGPSGETVLDYSLHDAARAGFKRVVFIIRSSFDERFRQQVGSRYERWLHVDYVHQELDRLPESFRAPEGRSKPWGTGHAVWCARDQLPGPFAVINADDFYGQASFRALADFLAPGPAKGCHAMVGFQLANTLSEHGSVSRGLCTVGEDGRLLGIEERTGILPESITAGGLRADMPVSMNCWGFASGFVDDLDAELGSFLAASSSSSTAEFYLPAAVNALLLRGLCSVRVLPTDASWFGVTHREDMPRVKEALRRLVESGDYPSPLLP